jgi:hypothetical protein
MPKAQPLLLDLYPSASVAYSLRKLRTAYSGSAIRVRRSSDNTEQDFGFVGNELDTASLLTFCGAVNGFVTTWYDQSGNGRNAIQASAVAQAAIVSNGSFIMIGSKITTNWANDSYTISAFLTNKPLVSTFVFKRNGIGNSGQCASFANSTTTVAAVLRWLGGASNNLNSYLNIGRTHSTNNQTLGYFLLTTYKTVADFVNVRNNTVELNGNIATGNGTINAFGNANESGTTGNVNEAILWYQDYVSLIPEIETKINEYYEIY